MTALQLPDPLVSTEWLHQNIDHPQLVIFDGSWHMPATGQDAFKEWQSEHIKGARFFDFDQTVCAPGSELPHMMPDAERFTREVQKLGLNRDSVVVIYDSIGMVTAPRVWWMLKSMGFDACALLDGRVNLSIQTAVAEWKGPRNDWKFVTAIYHDLGGHHWVDKI